MTYGKPTQACNKCISSITILKGKKTALASMLQPRMAVRYGTLVRYGTPQFLLGNTVRWYGAPFFLRYGYEMLVRYAFLEMVRVWYIGTLFEFAH